MHRSGTITRGRFRIFVVYMTVESNWACQIWIQVDSPSEMDVDGDGCNSGSVRQDAEHDAFPEVGEVKVKVAFSYSTCSVDKLHAECDGDCQADDLKSKTSNHDIDTSRERISSIMRGSQRPSGSLEHKTDKITHHECEGI